MIKEKTTISGKVIHLDSESVYISSGNSRVIKVAINSDFRKKIQNSLSLDPNVEVTFQGYTYHNNSSNYHKDTLSFSKSDFSLSEAIDVEDGLSPKNSSSHNH